MTKTEREGYTLIGIGLGLCACCLNLLRPLPAIRLEQLRRAVRQRLQPWPRSCCVVAPSSAVAPEQIFRPRYLGEDPMTLEPKALEAAAQEAKKWGWATGGPAFTAVLKAFADALPSPNGSGEQVSEAMVERIRNAVLSCSHTIVADEITLRRSEGKDGNALRQLSDRIRVALSASMAGPVHEGWRLITDDPPLDRKFLGASIDALRADGTRRPDNIWLIRGRHIDYAGGPAHWTWNEAEGGGYGIRLTHWHELPPLPAAAALRSLSRTQP